KIAMAQINPTVGDFEGNSARILAADREAASKGAELTVFSEMCLLGCNAHDLREKPAFLEAQDRAIARLRESLRGMPAVIGIVERHKSSEGRGLFNTAEQSHHGETGP